MPVKQITQFSILWNIMVKHYIYIVKICRLLMCMNTYPVHFPPLPQPPFLVWRCVWMWCSKGGQSPFVNLHCSFLANSPFLLTSSALATTTLLMVISLLRTIFHLVLCTPDCYWHSSLATSSTSLIPEHELFQNMQEFPFPVEHINTTAKIKTRLQMVQGLRSMKNPKR